MHTTQKQKLAYEEQANQLLEGDETFSSALQEPKNVVGALEQDEQTTLVSTALSKLDTLLGTDFSLSKSQREQKKYVQTLNEKMQTYHSQQKNYVGQEQKLSMEVAKVKTKMTMYSQKKNVLLSQMEEQKGLLECWESMITSDELSLEKKLGAQNCIDEYSLELRANESSLKLLEKAFEANKKNYSFIQSQLLKVKNYRLENEIILSSMETIREGLHLHVQQQASGLDLKSIVAKEVTLRRSMDAVYSLQSDDKTIQESRAVHAILSDSVATAMDKLTTNTYTNIGM
jgi:hypothetical protein